MKREDERHKHEMEALLKQTQLENERRKEERDHELKLFSLLVSAQGTRGDNPGLTEMAAPHPMPSYFPYSWDQATNYSSHSTNSTCTSIADENLQYTTL